MSAILRVLGALFAVGFLLALVGAGVGAYVIASYSEDLPDYKQLAEYEPATVTRVHAGDGRLLEEYAAEKRVFVAIRGVPDRVIDAFLSAEDKTFWDHPGIDLPSIARAAIVNIMNLGTNRRPVGASTITQQVAKNFLLTSEVSIERKLKEMILAFRIERAYSKERILELYLNEIYLGLGSYGIGAAALNYFNKSLDELTIAEAAYLAALPKAPSNYHPLRQHEAAVNRRNWVIGRMHEDGHITAEEAEAARNEVLTIRKRGETEITRADHFAEEVRRKIAGIYGEEALYEGGLSVRTTLDPEMQRIAERSLREGLEAYDRRHGWRGPVARIEVTEGWAERLAEVEMLEGLRSWRPAAVLALEDNEATIGFTDGSRGRIPFSEVKWARPWRKGQNVGPAPDSISDVLQSGDAIVVEKLEKPKEEEGASQAPAEEGGDETLPAYALRQVPEVNGALVALDPHTGRILAMVGGWSYARSEYNRATQARRQPGSAFKPIVYLTALENGYTPATIIVDGPVAIDQGPGLEKWKPKNYSNKFYGPSLMRVGIEKSRNLMTVRLAQSVGMRKVANMAEQLNVVEDMPPLLAMALGAGETTLLNLTTAYGMIVNGGKKITPTLIDRVQDRHGETVFKHDQRPCPKCEVEAWGGQPVPELPDQREQVLGPVSAYQMVSMLEGVVQRGTGRRIASLGRPLGGKTGTTNDNLDTWFIGFSPDLVAGVFVGFDDPRPLGSRETGSSAAAPIFKSFMGEVLKEKPPIPFRTPPGARLVRLNSETGQPAEPGDQHVMYEVFKPDTIPSVRHIDVGSAPDSDRVPLSDFSTQPSDGDRSNGSSLGGLY